MMRPPDRSPWHRPRLSMIGRGSHVCRAAGLLAALAGPVSPAAAQGVQPGGADSVLTADALTRLMTFWTAFAKENDTVQAVRLDGFGSPHALAVLDTVYSGSRINRAELVQNMIALAARYPSVAADLTQAGLTSQRYQVIFATLLTTCRTANGMAWGNPVTPTPRQAKNIAFLKAHPREFDALFAVAGDHIYGLADCGRRAMIVPRDSLQ